MAVLGVFTLASFAGCGTSDATNGMTGGPMGSGGSAGSSASSTGGSRSASGGGGSAGASVGPTGNGGAGGSPSEDATVGSSGGTPTTDAAGSAPKVDASGGRGGGPPTGDASAGAGGADGSSAPSALTITASWSNGAILTGVRDVASPAVTQVLQLHNGGPSAIMVSALAIDGANRAAFQINAAPQLPATLAAGADLPVTVQVATSGNALPAAPAQNDGGTLLTGALRATAGNRTRAARLLEISHRALLYKLKELDIRD